MTKPVPRVSAAIWNVPNILTFMRIFLSIALFVVMPFHWYNAALILFIIGSLTDFADGWWARKFQQMTKLGRIADPFADKLLVCGTLIYLVAEKDLAVPLPCCGYVNIGFAPWMVVLIISRELLVTMIRAAVEASGGDFSAKWVGKFKMAFQCFSIIAAYLYLASLKEACPYAGSIKWLMVALLWITIYLTIHSCIQYILIAIKIAKARKENL